MTTCNSVTRAKSISGNTAARSLRPTLIATATAFAIVLFFLFATAQQGRAADLYERGDHYDKQASAYDDPRYRAIYGGKAAKAEKGYRHSDDYGHGKGRYRRYSSNSYSSQRGRLCDRDERYSYSGDGLSYDYGRRSYDRAGSYSNRCLHKSVIRRRLKEDGWYAFKLIRMKSDYAILRARLRTGSRGDGEKYRLRVDRCTGEILRAKPLDRDYDRRDTYAYRNYQSYRSF